MLKSRFGLINSSRKKAKKVSGWPGCVCIGLSGLMLVLIYVGSSKQASQAQSIFDLVTKSKNTSKASSSPATPGAASTSGSAAGATGTTSGVSGTTANDQTNSSNTPNGEIGSSYMNGGQFTSTTTPGLTKNPAPTSSVQPNSTESSLYPSSGQAGNGSDSPYQSSGNSGTASDSPYQSSGNSGTASDSPYPSSGQGGTGSNSPYPSSGSGSGGTASSSSSSPGVQAGLNAVGDRAASGLQNAVNRGIQSNLQRGISRGANALDSLGRKVGLPGLGGLLNSPNSFTNDPGAINTGGGYSPSGDVAQSGAGESTYRRHVPSSGYHGSSSVRPLDAGKAAYDAAGKRARESQEQAYLRSAQAAEARGDWNQAAFAYRNAVTDYAITPEDDEVGRRKQIGSNAAMLERQANDPRYRQMHMKAAYCDVQLLNQDYAGVKTNVDKKHTEHGLSNLYDTLMYSDKGNAAWYYLKAVWWCSEYRSPKWNYVMAFNLINDALKCPHISPSIREKCTTLQEHIRPARDLQREDRQRSQYSIEQETVWAKENPQVVSQDVSETRVSIDATHERVSTWTRPRLNTEFWEVERYDEYKRDLREKYPAWKTAWLRLLNEKMNAPNPGVPVPQGPSNEEPAMYCPRRWEDLAFGPLDFKIGRDFPLTRRVPGMGHYDHDLLPKPYMARWNTRFLDK